MATYPKDSFDSVPDDLLRVGAHRAPTKRGRGWIAFAWAVAATIVLVVVGLYTLTALTGRTPELPFFPSEPSASATPTVKPTPTVAPKLDPTVPITVLNGTPTQGLATSVGDYLVAQGWKGAAVGVGTRASATSDDIEKTFVYYTAPADEGAARALALTLKADGVQLSTVYTARMVVVLGSDYKPQA